MPQAKHIHTISSKGGVKARSRERFSVIKGGRKPQSSIMQLIDKLAAELAAGGPLFFDAVKAPRNPYINHYGKILDPEKAALWEADRRNQHVQARFVSLEAHR